MKSTGRQARPSANATGTRRIMSVKNVPKSSIAATVGVSAAPLNGLPPRLRLAPRRCPPRGSNSRLGTARRRSCRRSVDDRAQIGAELRPEKKYPGKTGERPAYENPRHRHFGQLGVLTPPELHELD